MVEEKDIPANWIYSFTICKREAWLISHGIEGYQNNEYLELGRLTHEESYKKEKKETIKLPGLSVDLIINNKEGFMIGEIKSSSKKIAQAKIQLMYYIFKLKEYGFNIKGELLIPKEKKRIKVELTSEDEIFLSNLLLEIKELINQPKPPKPVRKGFCAKCDYFEFCWG
jgi:CRISPR-associated exonuclease Cas4